MHQAIVSDSSSNDTSSSDPIVTDLDGYGVEINLDQQQCILDWDADDSKERTAWAGADDGLLVIDLNNDGQVTQSKELAFAEWTSEIDTDLQALAKVFDSNKDSTFDSRYARFAEFRIWKHHRQWRGRCRRDADAARGGDSSKRRELQEVRMTGTSTTEKPPKPPWRIRLTSWKCRVYGDAYSQPLEQ